MKVEFFDRQDDQNPLNGMIVDEKSRLSQLFDQLQQRVPFFCELLGQNGYKLMLGTGGQRGCVQYSRIDGVPPYLMAVSPDQERSSEGVEFLIGGTPTPVPSRYCLPFDVAKDVIEYFQMTGERSPTVPWDEI